MWLRVVLSVRWVVERGKLLIDVWVLAALCRAPPFLLTPRGLVGTAVMTCTQCEINQAPGHLEREMEKERRSGS